MMRYTRGFTLIELVVTTALLGGILILLGVIVSASYQNTSFLTGRGAMTAALSNTLETITSYVVLGSDLPATYTHDSVTYTQGPSTMIIAIPSLNAQEEALPSLFDTVVIDCAQVQSECSLGVFPASASSRTQTNRTIASGLTETLFSYVQTSGQKSVTVTLTGSQETHGTTTTFPVTQTIYLLNQLP